MSDIKIGDKVVGIKGATRVAGIVMNIKEGHVHIKSPVAGVYAPVVNIVPLHKVTKLGEGAMKRKAEDEDDAGMSDYMHHVQTSKKPDASQAASDAEKKKHISSSDMMKLSKIHQLLHKEETKSPLTNKNQEHAVHVAGQPVTAYPNSTQAQRVGLKLKDMLGKKTVSVHHMGEESAHSIVNNLKADGKHEEAGAKAFEHGLGRKYGQHFGLRSTKDKDEASFHRGYDTAEVRSKKKVDEEVEQIDEVTPPGREKQVRALKKKPGITNPYAVAWSSYNKSHIKEDPQPIDEKSMYQNKLVKMTAHTEKDGRVYRGTHTVIVKKVPTLDTPTIQAQTRKRAENSLKAHLKSRGHKVTGIEHLEEAPNYRTHGSYDRGSNDIFDRSRRGFKSREHEFEAEVEARHHAAQVQHDSEPHHIYINGRVWKKDGQPVPFNGKKHANAAGLSILKKDPTKDVKIAHHSFHAKHGDTMPTSNS